MCNIILEISSFLSWMSFPTPDVAFLMLILDVNFDLPRHVNPLTLQQLNMPIITFTFTTRASLHILLKHILGFLVIYAPLAK